MPHLEDDVLSLFALGEPVPADAEAHLLSCPDCAIELVALRSIVLAVRDDGPPVRVAPPDRVWERVAAATGVAGVARPERVLAHAGSAPAGFFGLRPRGRLVTLATGCLVIGLILGGLGDRLLLAGSSSSSAPSASSAAASSAATPSAASAGTYATTTAGGHAQVLAAAALTGLAPAPRASGEADVVRTTTGRQLDLNVSRLAAPTGFYEVWLINPAITEMVAVGILTGDAGQFALPSDVQLARYPLVDVSNEPLDGNPGHSGTSVLRGPLRS